MSAEQISHWRLSRRCGWPLVWRQAAPGAEACTRTVVGVAIVTIGLGLVGCAGSGRTGRDSPLSPSPSPYERDIPIPVGFRLTDHASEDWSNGSIRYVRHRYEGRADRFSVRRFYRKQMPLVRWTAVDDGNVSGRCTQRFVRERESCTITIEDSATALRNRVTIEVLIVPSGGAERTHARLP